jgi:hypothetical protein
MDAASLLRVNYRGIYASDILVPIATFIMSSFFTSLEKSLLICFLCGSVSVVLNLKWNLRKLWWFWIIISAFVIMNSLAIYYVSLPSAFKMAAAFAPLVILEGLILLGFIGLVERRRHRS